MSVLYTESREQRDAVLAVVRWFDEENTSVHHALIMAAERNEESARDPEVLRYGVPEGEPIPEGHTNAITQLLIESAARWRAIAAQIAPLSEHLGDVERVRYNPHAL